MSALVDPETGETVRSESGIRFPDEIRLADAPMDADEARQITVKITGYAKSICYLVRAAHQGQAHLALGFDTWGDYCEELLGITRQRAQQLIDHAFKLDLTADVTGLARDIIDMLPERATRGIAREDVPALASTAVATAGPDATPEQQIASVKETFTESKTTTYETSPDASSAPGDRTGSIGSTPAAPGATSPGQNIEPSADDAGGSPGQRGVADSETESAGSASAADPALPQIAAVPDAPDGAAAGDLMDSWPVPGQWSNTPDLDAGGRAFARFMDKRLPRDDETPQLLAAACPAPLRSGASSAARVAARTLTELADLLDRPVPLAAVES